jgi:ADP-heptose:LPS heptosyltransferase
MTDFILHRYGGLGDVLMALGAVKALHMAGHRATVMTSPHLQELVARCPWAAPLFSGVEVDLSPAIYGLAPMHQIDAYLASFEMWDVPEAHKTIDLGVPSRPKERVIGLHVTARDPNRAYPHWPEVIRRIQDKGFGIHILGGSSFRQSLDIISRLHCVIAPDSGPIQLAGATDTPIIGLYSSVRGEWRRPFGRQFTAIEPEGCPYFPCYQTLEKINLEGDLDVTFGNWCPRGRFCLGDIPPEKIISMIP